MKSLYLAIFLVLSTQLSAVNTSSLRFETARVYESAVKEILGHETPHGEIPVKKDGSSIFYWLFPSQNAPETAPVIVWLTGGPGCSSELTMFTENGPLHIELGTTEWRVNPWSWNKNYNLIYLDQPIGTGLSVAKTPEDLATNEDEVAQMFYNWQVGFLKKHPEFRNRDLYLTGESYGGQYIPFIAKKLVDEMKDIGNEDPLFELKGVTVGNGWFDNAIQFPAYLDFSLYSGIITLDDYFRLQPAFRACGELMKYKIGPAATACKSLREILMSSSDNHLRFNMYDYTKPCPDDLPLCYDFSYVSEFFSRKSVKLAEGFDANKDWSDCNTNVYDKLVDNDYKTSTISHVGELLDLGLKVLIYAGDKDFICNWVGQENWTNAVKWEFKESFNLADKKEEFYGEKKCSRNFAYVKVPEAGHMVPKDQPEMALAMIADFTNGSMFDDCE